MKDTCQRTNKKHNNKQRAKNEDTKAATLRNNHTYHEQLAIKLSHRQKNKETHKYINNQTNNAQQHTNIERNNKGTNTIH